MKNIPEFGFMVGFVTMMAMQHYQNYKWQKSIDENNKRIMNNIKMSEKDIFNNIKDNAEKTQCYKR